MAVLKAFDIYGSVFSFTTFGENKFKTKIGGIISLMTLVLLVVFGFMFGRDFLYRVNPRIISQSVVPNDYPAPLKLTNDNLIVAWRIEDLFAVEVNFTGVIYPMIHYSSFIKDNVTNEWKDFNVTLMNFSRCDQIGNYSELNPPYDPSKFYCFDWNSSDYFFGGNWDAEFIYFWTLSFSYCPHYAYSEDGNCTKLEDINKYFLSENPWYLSVVYPQFYFSPDSLDQPLNVWYSNYYYKLGMNLQRNDRFYFQNYELDDDQGWIFSSPVKSNMYGFSKNSFDYNYLTNEDLLTNGHSSIFYIMEFYMEKQYQLYSRSYMKFQDLAAVIGGFVKIIIIACEFICNLVNVYMRNDLLFNRFFDLTEPSVEDRRKILSDSVIPLGKINKSDKVFNQENSVEILKSNAQMLDDIYTKFKKDKQGFNSQRTHVNFGVRYQIRRICCKGGMKKTTEQRKLSVYTYMKKYMEERLDVLHYLGSLKKIEQICLLLFNRHQAASFEFLKHTNPYELYDRKLLDPLSKEKELKEVIIYFSDRIKLKALDSVDSEILKNIQVEIFNLIKKES